MTEKKPATLINAQTPLSLALNRWKMYLEDQGSSVHTVKAFMGDMNLLASYPAPGSEDWGDHNP